VIHAIGRRCRGFTLAEILVVLLVLGIGAAVLVPRLALSPARTLQHDAERLARSLEMASQIAQWRGVTLGVSIEPGGYRFWERDEPQGRWRTSREDGLQPATFATPVTAAQVSYSGVRVDASSVLPFNPSGRNQPIEIGLTADGATAWVRSDLLNRVGVSMR
jgi:general secretion pathway protein H